HIKVGFATLKDKVFFIGRGIDDCTAVQPLTGQRYAIEPELTRVALHVADAVDARDDDPTLASPARPIVFPYRLNQQGKWEIIDEMALRRLFPVGWRYLSDCREILMTRDRGKQRYEAWYAWGRTQGRFAPGPKLLTKTFSRRPRFYRDDSNRLFSNGYS